MAAKDEEIGYHKGALTTLAKERTELKRILDIVEQLMQFHASELKKIGVDITGQAKKAERKSSGKKK